MNAYGPTLRDGVEGGFNVALESEGDLRRLIDFLGEEHVSTAAINGPHAVMDVHVADGFGYLLYSGDDAYVVSVGVPESPEVRSETGFPAGSGVPLHQFTAALVEWWHTAQLPSSVQWRPA